MAMDINVEVRDALLNYAAAETNVSRETVEANMSDQDHGQLGRMVEAVLEVIKRCAVPLIETDAPPRVDFTNQINTLRQNLAHGLLNRLTTYDATCGMLKSVTR